MKLSGQFHAVADLFLGKNPGTLRVGSFMGLWASLDILVKRKIPWFGRHSNGWSSVP